MNCQELSGEMAAPRLRSGDRAHAQREGDGRRGVPGNLMAQRRPWSLESGAGEEGGGADAQLKWCASVMMPPMVVPCPPNHLVSELTTSSRPVFDAAQQVNGAW
jgi:hypothetical protein